MRPRSNHLKQRVTRFNLPADCQSCEYWSDGVVLDKTRKTSSKDLLAPLVPFQASNNLLHSCSIESNQSCPISVKLCDRMANSLFDTTNISCSTPISQVPKANNIESTTCETDKNRQNRQNRVHWNSWVNRKTRTSAWMKSTKGYDHMWMDQFCSPSIWKQDK